MGGSRSGAERCCRAGVGEVGAVCWWEVELIEM